ncbi:hypothetical protein EWM64_g8207 [Hericium alpestre]|uniref:Uncharacterized protein n=1 Tax=Hericium alpestre TaxID=135208 RepID=A0A4Y9ZME9_9AGAM|nr:hypothetical protein EWM64_g8207 [Hericium alpestre]
MPSPSNLSTSTDIVPDQTGHCAIQSEALHSAITSHQATSSTLVMVPRGEKGPERQRALLRLRDDYIHGRVTHAELHAMLDRLRAAEDAVHRRYLDFKARDRAGQAKPTDYFVGIYGYTEEEAEECIEEGARALDMRLANEARSRTRILQNSRSERGH